MSAIRFCITIASLLLTLQAAGAASLPSQATAKDYPADAYAGPNKQPGFKGADRAFYSFRTSIRDGVRQGPNFAGGMAVIVVGCGAGCTTAFAADVSTGRVYAFPIGGEDFPFMHLGFTRESRLVTAHWVKDSRCVQEQLLWNGKSFETSAVSDAGDEAVCDALWRN